MQIEHENEIHFWNKNRLQKQNIVFNKNNGRTFWQKNTGIPEKEDW